MKLITKTGNVPRSHLLVVADTGAITADQWLVSFIFIYTFEQKKWEGYFYFLHTFEMLHYDGQFSVTRTKRRGGGVVRTAKLALIYLMIERH